MTFPKVPARDKHFNVGPYALHTGIALDTDQDGLFALDLDLQVRTGTRNLLGL